MSQIIERYTGHISEDLGLHLKNDYRHLEVYSDLPMFSFVEFYYLSENMCEKGKFIYFEFLLSDMFYSIVYLEYE